MTGVRYAVVRFCAGQRYLVITPWVLGGSRRLPSDVQLRYLSRVRGAAAALRRELFPWRWSSGRNIGRVAVTLVGALATLIALPIASSSANTTGLRNQRYYDV